MGKSTTPSKQGVAALFSQQAQNLGLDDDAVSVVVANLNATTLPMCVGTPLDEIESDANTIIMFVIDESPSMEPVEQEVITGFNDVIIPALRKASKKTQMGMHIGGVAFTERVRSLWGGGFHKVEDIQPLTKRDYDTQRGSSTALHQAILDALTATSAYTATLLAGTGTPPKTIIVVLSDGANNCRPDDPDVVAALIKTFSREIFVFAFAGFQTNEPVDFKEIARGLSFPAVMELKKEPGEDDATIQRRFRHLIGTVSSSVIRASQARVSASQASASFWQKPTQTPV